MKQGRGAWGTRKLSGVRSRGAEGCAARQQEILHKIVGDGANRSAFFFLDSYQQMI